MANAIYGKSRQLILEGGIAILTDNIKCVLVDAASYAVNIDFDGFLSDIPAGMRISTSIDMTTKTSLLGVFDADDVTFSTVTGAESEALVIYKDTAVEGTSPLIAYIDTATGLPVIPNGGDIVVTWDDGVNKIFKL